VGQLPVGLFSTYLTAVAHLLHEDRVVVAVEAGVEAGLDAGAGHHRQPRVVGGAEAALEGRVRGVLERAQDRERGAEADGGAAQRRQDGAQQTVVVSVASSL